MPQSHSPTKSLFAESGSETPLSLLKRVYGYASFRGRQEEVVDHVMAGGDAVVLFPTGAGKSLCFQVPALCRNGLGIVVSPLIALMRDQVEAPEATRCSRSGAQLVAVARRVHGCAQRGP